MAKFLDLLSAPIIPPGVIEPEEPEPRWKRLLGAFASGATGLGATVARGFPDHLASSALTSAGNLFDSDFLRKAGSQGPSLADRLQGASDAAAPQLPEEYEGKWLSYLKDQPVQAIAEGVLSSAPQTAATVAATAFGGPAAGLAVGGGLEGEGAYREARAQGAGIPEALGAGAFTGVVGGFLERIGAGSILKSAGPVPLKALREIAEAAATEGLTEIGQELTNITAVAGATGEAPRGTEILDRLAQAGILGGATGGGMRAALSRMSDNDPEGGLPSPDPLVDEFLEDFTAEKPVQPRKGLDFYKRLINEDAPIERMAKVVDKSLDAKGNSNLERARQVVGRARRAAHIARGPIFENTQSADGTVTGESYWDITSGMTQDQVRDTNALLLAERHLELDRRAQPGAVIPGLPDPSAIPSLDSPVDAQPALDPAFYGPAEGESLGRIGPGRSLPGLPAGQDLPGSPYYGRNFQALDAQDISGLSPPSTPSGAPILDPLSPSRIPASLLRPGEVTEAPLVPGDDLSIDPVATERSRAIAAHIGAKGPETAERAQRIREWTGRSILDTMVEMGYLSADQRVAVDSKNEYYAPLTRVIEGLENSLAGTSEASLLREITGGLSEEKKARRPMEYLAEKAQAVHQVRERLLVRKYVVELAEKNPGLFPEITEINPGERGYSPETTFVDYQNGVQKRYSAPEDVLSLLNRVRPQDMSLMESLLRFPAAMLRTGATGTPGFGVFNLLRDAPQALVYTKATDAASYIPGANILRGIAHIAGNTDLYKEYKTSGGSHGSIVSPDLMSPEVTMKMLQTKGRAGLSAATWVEASRKNPLQAFLMPLQAFGHATDAVVRVGNYAGERKSDLSREEAALSTSDLTLDFLRAGTDGRRWNAVEAFGNVALQDPDKFARSMANAPGKTILKASVFYTIPAVLNWFANKDDEDYQRKADWEKSMFYHWRLPEATAESLGVKFFRWPRGIGSLPAVFSVAPHYMLDFMESKDPEAIRKLAKAFRQHSPAQYIPGTGGIEWVPTAMEPMVETAMNYSNFRERPIDPAGQENLQPQYRGYDNTSPSLKALSGAISSPVQQLTGDPMSGVSPLKLDHLVQGYGASMGKTAVDTVDAIGRGLGMFEDQPQPPGTVRDIPVVRRFFSHEARGPGSAQVRILYEKLKTAQGVSATVKQLQQRRDTEAAKALEEQYPEGAYASELGRASRSLSELRKARNAAYSKEDWGRVREIDEKMEAVASAVLRKVAAAEGRSRSGPGQDLGEGQEATPLWGWLP